MDWLQRAKETCDYNLKNILTFKVGIPIISLTLRPNSCNCAYRFQINQYALIRLGSMQLLHPPSREPDGDRHLSLPPTLYCCHCGQDEPYPGRNSPCKCALYLPCTPKPSACFSPASHTTIMPFFCFLIPAQFCLSLLLQHLNSNFCHPINFDSFSTLKRNDSDLPNSNKL